MTESLDKQWRRIQENLNQLDRIIDRIKGKTCYNCDYPLPEIPWSDTHRNYCSEMCWRAYNLDRAYDIDSEEVDEDED